MDALMDSLCEQLDDEVERQQNVLAVCTAQREAVFARDLDALSSRTSALEILIRESIQAQTKRIETLRPIVDHFGLSPDRQTMTHLIEASPEPWKSRLQDVQHRLRDTVERIRVAVRANARVTRQSKKVTDDLIRALRQEHHHYQHGYSDRGAEQSARGGEPVLMDQRG